MPGLPAHHEMFARAALPAYGRREDCTLKLLSLSENATYLVDDGDPVVLRVHRPGYHSLQAIRSELTWMSALRDDTDVQTPHLILADDARDVVTVRVGDDALHVDAVSYIPGCTAEEASDAVGFDELGRLSAAMHDHVQRWTPPDYFTRFRWDLPTMLHPQARWGDWRDSLGLTETGARVITQAAAVIDSNLTEFGCGPARFGLAHADLRMANLMVDPATSEVTVIDFDDCGWSWYLADLGAVVSFIEHTPDCERIIADWLRGYRQVRALPAEDVDMIPTFVMLRRIMLSAWIASHRDADAAIALGDAFTAGTVELADRYLSDRRWLRDAIA